MLCFLSSVSCFSTVTENVVWQTVVMLCGVAPENDTLMILSLLGSNLANDDKKGNEYLN